MERDSNDIDSVKSFDAIVVGSGFAGMYMLHRLRGLGLTARVFESASDVGGTWYWNRYPGARCDVTSLDYSYSFSAELEQEWVWTEKFAPQPEILSYAQFVAKKFDLRRDIQFDTRIDSAVYDTAASRWTITTAAGEKFSSRFCIMATGCLSAPKDPVIPGMQSFEGPIYFTSRWPHEGVDFSGKSVGVIGTGSSGIQVIPELAQQAEHLTVFQRTPSFTIPARNVRLEPGLLDEVKRKYPERRALARAHPNGHLRPLTDRETFSVDEAERRALFENAWESGGVDIFGQFGDLLVNEQANAVISSYIHEKIDAVVEKPEVAEALKPRDYPFGGRRVCLDTEYYETFNRPNVTLVDLLTDPLDAIVPDGVKTRDRHVPVDALVLATGFDAMTGALLAVDIRGRDGRSLRDKWAHGPMSYLGLAIEGFPNLFTITGPGSPSVLSNVIASIEQHVEWISDVLAYMKKAHLTEIEATAEAETDWVHHAYELADKTLFMKANSWFLGANVPGKPRVFMPYVGGLVVYRKFCDEIAAENYRGFRLSG